MSSGYFWWGVGLTDVTSGEIIPYHHYQRNFVKCICCNGNFSYNLPFPLEYFDKMQLVDKMSSCQSEIDLKNRLGLYLIFREN